MSIELRRKYAEGITSKEYIKTGEPRLKYERVKTDCAEIEAALEENERNTAKAIKSFRKWRAKRKGPEYKIIFE